MVSTIYFNGMKMYTELHDTPNGLNKWFAGGKWFLGKSVVFKRYFLGNFTFECLLRKLRRGQFLLIVKQCNLDLRKILVTPKIFL